MTKLFLLWKILNYNIISVKKRNPGFFSNNYFQINNFNRNDKINNNLKKKTASKPLSKSIEYEICFTRLPIQPKTMLLFQWPSTSMENIEKRQKAKTKGLFSNISPHRTRLHLYPHIFLLLLFIVFLFPQLYHIKNV